MLPATCRARARCDSPWPGASVAEASACDKDANILNFVLLSDTTCAEEMKGGALREPEEGRQDALRWQPDDGVPEGKGEVRGFPATRVQPSN